MGGRKAWNDFNETNGYSIAENGKLAGHQRSGKRDLF